MIKQPLGKKEKAGLGDEEVLLLHIVQSYVFWTRISGRFSDCRICLDAAG